MDCESLIVNTLIKASNDYIEFSPAIDRIRYIIDNTCPTMSMSKDLELRVNSQFFSNLPEESRIPVILHEVLHYLLNHHARYARNIFKDKLPFNTHNVAMDLEINQYLKDKYINENGLTPQKFKYPKGLSYEEYLYYIMNNDNNKMGGSEGNQSGEEDTESLNGKMPMKGSSGNIYITKKDIEELQSDDGLAEQEQEVQSINEKCQEALEHAMGEGEGSSFDGKLRKVKPKPYKWDKILNTVMSAKADEKEFGFDNRTYRKYNKRLNGISNVIFPSTYNIPNKLNLYIGIDISGSMYNIIDEMYARVKSLTRSIDFPINLTILECDTHIQKIITNFNFNNDSVESGDGGGTDMNSIPLWVFENVKDKKIEEPDLIVIMTDNECSWNDDLPYFKKTIVLTTNISKNCPYKQYEVTIE